MDLLLYPLLGLALGLLFGITVRAWPSVTLGLGFFLWAAAAYAGLAAFYGMLQWVISGDPALFFVGLGAAFMLIRAGNLLIDRACRRERERVRQ